MKHYTRLLHTTAIRLALRYALYFALLIAVGLGVLYWAISRYVDAQMAAGLARESAELVEIDRRYGRDRLIAAIQMQQAPARGKDRRYYLVQAPDGKTQAGSLTDWPPQLPVDNRVRNVWIEDDVIAGHMPDDDGYWPMIGARLKDNGRLLVAQSVHQAEDLLEFILSTMALILTVAVGMAAALGWLLGRNLLERIDAINLTAEQVTAGDLSKRVSLSDRDDEFDQLSGHLNTMLDRIEHLLTGMRQVTDNVAHDLRRPLARMRNRIEVTLLEQRELKEYRCALEETMEDAGELMQTFNALLEIAQAEAGSFRGDWDNLDLSALLEDLGELYNGEAEAQARRFEWCIEAGLQVKGNRHLLAQAVSNLLDNAFKYSPADSAIELLAETSDGRVCLAVSDNGPGIPARQRTQVLERFVRLDTERSTIGSGLGLSLVKAVAELHKAAMTLEDNRPGLRVTLCFST